MELCATNVAQDFWSCRLTASQSSMENQSKPRVKMFLVIDNSGSMGGLTRQLTNTIGKEMLNLDRSKLDLEPSTLILFDTKPHIVSNKLCFPADLDKVQYPSQGMTNVTAAIQLTVQQLLANGDNTVHNVLVFLSDGMHNSGPQLSQALTAEAKLLLDRARIRLSVLVVGIASSDTRLGMLIKSGLETVPLRQMKTIYYTQQGFQDIQSLLRELNQSCTASLCSGSTLGLRLTSEGHFVDNRQRELSVFLSESQADFIVRGPLPPVLQVGEQQIASVTRPASASDVVAIVDHLLLPLSQRRVAQGEDSIRADIAQLEQMIDQAEIVFKQLEDSGPQGEIGQVKFSVGERLNLVRKARQSKTLFQEERNRLRSLLVALGNDSAKQAQFLNGMQGKYASKAVLKADMLDRPVSEVLDKVFALRQALNQALRTALDSGKTSILSLNSTAEQLAEWDEALTEGPYPDIYSLLVTFGFTGYSVRFDRNNAVQMDPFQTSCQDIDPSCFLDTPSILLANQLGRALKSPSGRAITDCLVLVDPACAEASLEAMRHSPIYEYVSSVTLCRDLYMYHPKMTFAMHAHALFRSLQQWDETEGRPLAFLELALRIAYSIRKFWGERVREGENVDLFKRWFVEWASITQSESDNCNHPVQLVLLLAALDLKELGIAVQPEINVPLRNLCNEALARWMKQILHSTCDRKGVQRTTPEINAIVLSWMHRLFGITKENSPQPNPELMQEEPSIESIRDNCQAWTEIDPAEEAQVLRELGLSGETILSAVEAFVRPWTIAYQFGLCLQLLLSETGGWSSLCAEMEAGGEVPIEFLQRLAQSLEKVDLSFSSLLSDDSRNAASQAQCALLQACMNYDSRSRSGCIVEKDILYPETLQALIIDLRIAHYMDAFNVKKANWLAVIGDVTLAKALSDSPAEFCEMIGRHTHGHCKDKFWAMFKAALQDKEKRTIFLEKSSASVAVCFSKAGY